MEIITDRGEGGGGEIGRNHRHDVGTPGEAKDVGEAVTSMRKEHGRPCDDNVRETETFDGDFVRHDTTENASREVDCTVSTAGESVSTGGVSADHEESAGSNPRTGESISAGRHDAGHDTLDVGKCQSTCRSGTNVDASEDRRRVVPTVESSEVRQVWHAGDPQVCQLVEGRCDAESSVIHGDPAGYQEEVPGLNGTLAATRRGYVFSAGGILHEGDRSHDGAHSDRGSVTGCATICGPAPQTARGANTAENVDRVAAKPTGILEVISEAEVAGCEERDVPTVISFPYYPFQQVKVNVGGDRVAARRKVTNAELGTLCKTRLDYNAVWRLPAGNKTVLWEWLRWITTDLLVEHLGERRHSTKVSRGFEDIKVMFDAGVIVPDGGRSLRVMSLFKVLKKEGKARLIVDCREVNEELPAPGDMGLPNLHAVLDEMAKAEYVAQRDGLSYFYQFGLCGGAEDVFGARVGAKRGAFEKVRLTVLPMGFKFAPGIAQHMSMYVLENVRYEVGNDVGMTSWVDNFLFWGKKDQVKRALEVFERICREINLVLKPDGDEGTSMEVLGVWVDTHEHTLRIRGESGQESMETAREVFQVFGKGMWGHYAVTRRPLCMYEECLMVLGRIGKEAAEKGWDAKVYLSNGESQALRQFAEESYGIRQVKDKEGQHMTVWSDASTTGYGWVLEEQQKSWVGMYARGDNEDIFVAELLAAVRGAATADSWGYVPVALVDNQAAQRALAKG
eukprot:PhM_4_TR8419/c5_g1_i3/m.8264